jgi:transcriptional regulator with XRE-family HTH domain
VGRKEPEAQPARLRAVREATGLTQLQFLAKLNAAAERLGTRAYVQSLLSRLENGLQVPSFDDIAVYASIDPERRGKLWLAWGEAEDATLKARPGARDIPIEAMERVSSKKPAPRKRANDR